MQAEWSISSAAHILVPLILTGLYIGEDAWQVVKNTVEKILSSSELPKKNKEKIKYAFTEMLKNASPNLTDNQKQWLEKMELI